MIRTFLSAKHWQLFILLFIVPYVLQMIMTIKLFESIQNEGDINFDLIQNILQYFPIIIFIFTSIFCGWLWSVGIGLQDKIPENINMKVGQFKFFLIVPLLYIFNISIFISTFNPAEFLAPTINVGIILFILLLQLVSVFCIFYCFYFVAKTIKTIELQKEVTFSDFVGEFFLIWFLIIGIWILQPKINKIAEESALVKEIK